MNKNLLTLTIVILAVAIVIVNIWKPADEEKKTSSQEDNIAASGNPAISNFSEIQEGKPAPDFQLTTLNGESVKLSDYKGKKVILNFWATWCPPCKAEMPHMENFYEHNKDKGIEILAVNLTNSDKGQAAVEAFVTDNELTFPVPLDESGEIGARYQAITIPTSYIIDSNGIISKKIVGPMDENMMETVTNDIE